MLKKRLNNEEKVGLSDEEIKLAEKYLRKHRTKGIVPEYEALQLLELYLIGTSFNDIQRQFPQYALSQILLTAGIKKWGLYRNKMMGSLQERVQAKVVKSVVDSVDFLTNMIQIAGLEFGDEMRNYLMDPKKNAKPYLRIKSFKDFRDALDSLQRLINSVSGVGNGGKAPAMLASMENNTDYIERTGKPKKKKKKSKSETNEAATLLAEVVED